MQKDKHVGQIIII